MKENSKERPILFSSPMVRAILEGRKSMTRRIVKNKISYEANRKGRTDLDAFGVLDKNGNLYEIEEGVPATLANGFCPYGSVGDVLWVRETFAEGLSNKEAYAYKSTSKWQDFEDGSPEDFKAIKWRPSIFMPKAACRIRLKITDIRVERLQEITEEDAKAEGIWLDESVYPPGYTVYGMPHWPTAVECFSQIWSEINGSESYDSNPFVWVIKFEKI